jgi:hypothetical protein
VRAILVWVLLVAVAVPAAAQSPVGRASVGVGASFLRSEGLTASGVTVDGAKSFALGAHVGIGPAGDFSFHRFEDFTITSLMGGGRLTLGNNAAQIFGQALFGYERCCGVKDFAWQPGVGLDIRLTSMLNLRGQLDFRIVRAKGQGGPVDSRELRGWFGVSLPFGG